MTASLSSSGTEQFTAVADDQFGQALASQPAFSWTVASGGIGGTITSAGLYTRPSPGLGSDTVIVSSGEQSGSAVVTVTTGAASRLVVTTQPPQSVTAGAGFGLVVSAEDDFGNVDPTFGGSVTLALADDPGASSLGGTVTMTADAGVAAFTNVTLNKASEDDTLQASSGGLVAQTDPFTVAAAPATQLVLTPAPAGNVTAGSEFGLVVSAEDPYGNVDLSFSDGVTVALANNPWGASLGGTTSVTASTAWPRSRA